MPEPTFPTDHADPPAGDAAADAVPRASPPVADRPAPTRVAPPAPLYRVVEVVRDRDGRLSSYGRVWHPDVDRARRFGRFVAGQNVTCHGVFVADGRGDVVERIPLPESGDAAPSVADWQALPLPPAPPRPQASRSRLARRRLAAAQMPSPATPPTLPVLDAPDEVAGPVSVGEHTVPTIHPADVAAARAAG